MKNFKRILALILCIMVSFSFTGCKKETEPEQDERILKAIDVLSEHWSEKYKQWNENGKMKYEDKYLEIINTKIVNIKDNIDAEKIGDKNELFENIDYIIEFELQSNWYNTAPYYSNYGMDNCVVVRKDGTSSVEEHSPLQLYRASTYSNNFSDIIESIENFHGEYDRVLEIE